MGVLAKIRSQDRMISCRQSDAGICIDLCMENGVSDSDRECFNYGLVYRGNTIGYVVITPGVHHPCLYVQLRPDYSHHVTVSLHGATEDRLITLEAFRLIAQYASIRFVGQLQVTIAVAVYVRRLELDGAVCIETRRASFFKTEEVSVEKHSRLDVTGIEWWNTGCIQVDGQLYLSCAWLQSREIRVRSGGRLHMHGMDMVPCQSKSTKKNDDGSKIVLRYRQVSTGTQITCNHPHFTFHPPTQDPCMEDAKSAFASCSPAARLIFYKPLSQRGDDHFADFAAEKIVTKLADYIEAHDGIETHQSLHMAKMQALLMINYANVSSWTVEDDAQVSVLRMLLRVDDVTVGRSVMHVECSFLSIKQWNSCAMRQNIAYSHIEQLPHGHWSWRHDHCSMNNTSVRAASVHDLHGQRQYEGCRLHIDALLIRANVTTRHTFFQTQVAEVFSCMQLNSTLWNGRLLRCHGAIEGDASNIVLVSSATEQLSGLYASGKNTYVGFFHVRTHILFEHACVDASMQTLRKQTHATFLGLFYDDSASAWRCYLREDHLILCDGVLVSEYMNTLENKVRHDCVRSSIWWSRLGQVEKVLLAIEPYVYTLSNFSQERTKFRQTLQKTIDNIINSHKIACVQLSDHAMLSLCRQNLETRKLEVRNQALVRISDARIDAGTSILDASTTWMKDAIFLTQETLWVSGMAQAYWNTSMLHAQNVCLDGQVRADAVQIHCDAFFTGPGSLLHVKDSTVVAATSCFKGELQILQGGQLDIVSRDTTIEGRMRGEDAVCLVRSKKTSLLQQASLCVGRWGVHAWLNDGDHPGSHAFLGHVDVQHFLVNTPYDAVIMARHAVLDVCPIACEQDQVKQPIVRRQPVASSKTLGGACIRAKSIFFQGEVDFHTMDVTYGGTLFSTKDTLFTGKQWVQRYQNIKDNTQTSPLHGSQVAALGVQNQIIRNLYPDPLEGCSFHGADWHVHHVVATDRYACMHGNLLMAEVLVMRADKVYADTYRCALDGRRGGVTIIDADRINLDGVWQQQRMELTYRQMLHLLPTSEIVTDAYIERQERSSDSRGGEEDGWLKGVSVLLYGPYSSMHHGVLNARVVDIVTDSVWLGVCRSHILSIKAWSVLGYRATVSTSFIHAGLCALPIFANVSAITAGVMTSAWFFNMMRSRFLYRVLNSEWLFLAMRCYQETSCLIANSKYKQQASKKEKTVATDLPLIGSVIGIGFLGCLAMREVFGNAWLKTSVAALRLAFSKPKQDAWLAMPQWQLPDLSATRILVEREKYQAMVLDAVARLQTQVAEVISWDGLQHQLNASRFLLSSWNTLSTDPRLFVEESFLMSMFFLGGSADVRSLVSLTPSIGMSANHYDMVSLPDVIFAGSNYQGFSVLSTNRVGSIYRLVYYDQAVAAHVSRHQWHAIGPVYKGHTHIVAVSVRTSGLVLDHTQVFAHFLDADGMTLTGSLVAVTNDVSLQHVDARESSYVFVETNTLRHGDTAYGQVQIKAQYEDRMSVVSSFENSIVDIEQQGDVHGDWHMHGDHVLVRPLSGLYMHNVPKNIDFIQIGGDITIDVTQAGNTVKSIEANKTHWVLYDEDGARLMEIALCDIVSSSLVDGMLTLVTRDGKTIVVQPEQTYGFDQVHPSNEERLREEHPLNEEGNDEQVEVKEQRVAETSHTFDQQQPDGDAFSEELADDVTQDRIASEALMRYTNRDVFSIDAKYYHLIYNGMENMPISASALSVRIDGVDKVLVMDDIHLIRVENEGYAITMMDGQVFHCEGGVIALGHQAVALGSHLMIEKMDNAPMPIRGNGILMGELSEEADVSSDFIDHWMNCLSNDMVLQLWCKGEEKTWYMEHTNRVRFLSIWTEGTVTGQLPQGTNASIVAKDANALTFGTGLGAVSIRLDRTFELKDTTSADYLSLVSADALIVKKGVTLEASLLFTMAQKTQLEGNAVEVLWWSDRSGLLLAEASNIHAQRGVRYYGFSSLQHVVLQTAYVRCYHAAYWIGVSGMYENTQLYMHVQKGETSVLLSRGTYEQISASQESGYAGDQHGDKTPNDSAVLTLCDGSLQVHASGDGDFLLENRIFNERDSVTVFKSKVVVLGGGVLGETTTQSYEEPSKQGQDKVYVQMDTTHVFDQTLRFTLTAVEGHLTFEGIGQATAQLVVTEETVLDWHSVERDEVVTKTMRVHFQNIFFGWGYYRGGSVTIEKSWEEDNPMVFHFDKNGHYRINDPKTGQLVQGNIHNDLGYFFNGDVAKKIQGTLDSMYYAGLFEDAMVLVAVITAAYVTGGYLAQYGINFSMSVGMHGMQVGVTTTASGASYFSAGMAGVVGTGVMLSVRGQTDGVGQVSLENQSGLVYAKVMGSGHFSAGAVGRIGAGNVVGIEGKSDGVGTVYLKKGRDMVYVTANRSGEVGVGGNTPDGAEYQVLTKQATTSRLMHGLSSHHLFTQSTSIGQKTDTVYAV